ncbi:WxcM-like domain-containing protein [Winogradskyella litorisediminis]|uniref:WxcM-like domain-containing protein n=1 Tax=Winogradskyella litorisediminis TaxID=1156618 RepID=A0ABW3N4F7_9FLAO
MQKQQPTLIKGGVFKDQRGKLDFFNDFDAKQIKRIYFTTHFDTKVIRAWQGHKVESRWFVCTNGSFQIKLVEIDNWQNPSNNLPIKEFKLSANSKQILHIPNGFVNGFRALEDNSQLMIMANYEFGEIENDEVRFNYNKWTTW